MRTKLYMIALAAMTMMLGSCSDSNSEFSQDFLADTPIKLNVSVDEPTTRAGYSDADKPTGFGLAVWHDINNDNDKYNYYVWAEWEDNNWKTYDLIPYMTNGTKREVNLLWANMNDNITITATSYNNEEDGTIRNNPTDQTTPDALKKADFLAMPQTKVKPTQSGINVEFKHTMSKINLTIELGSEYEFTKEDVDTKITDVKIDGSKVKASYEIHSSTKDPQFIFTSHSGDPTPISPYHTGTTPYSKTNGAITKAKATYEAILIPQTIASGNFTVSFKVDGKLYEWTYDKELTLAPTTAYTLKLTAGDDKVQPVSFSVAPWGKGNGDGEKKETD